MPKALPPFGEYESRRSNAETRRVCVASRVAAAPANVFDAWIDPEVARRWLFATASHQVAGLDIDARVGSGFRALDVRDGSSVEYVGRYLEIVPSRRLVFTLVLPESIGNETRVSVVLAATKSGSRIALLHEYLPPALAPGMKMRWTGMLYGLCRLLESNPRRPKLFNRDPCRFEPLPIDHKIDPPLFHHHQE